MSTSEHKVDNLKTKLVESIKDYKLLAALRDEFGQEVLKDTTLGNWRSRGEIPNTAIDGAILGRELAPDGLENVPRDLLKTRWGDIEIRGLWAEAVWHILRLSDPPEEDEGQMWHLWENINALPVYMLPKSRQIFGKSWLLHLSEGEPGNLVKDWVRLPENDEEAKVGLVEYGVAYEKSVPLREMGQLPERDKRPCGYRFTASKSFRKKQGQGMHFEYFGGRATIPVQYAHVLISIPQTCIALNAFYPFVPAKTFASNRHKIMANYVNKVLAQSLVANTQHELDLFDSGLFATWGETFNVELSSPSTEPRLPSLINPGIADLEKITEQLEKKEQQSENETERKKLKIERDKIEKKKTALEREAHAEFFAGRYVFHAIFPLPNPLSYQMLFWPLPGEKT